MLWQTLSFTELGAHRLYAVLHLRQAVFVVEQDCAYLDCDNRDQGAVHMLATQGEALLAYQRCIPPGPDCADSRLGRVVVSPQARGRQLGRELVRRGIEHNLQRWPDADIRIHAQAYLEKFYAELGFVTEGDIYDLDSIPHLEMVLARAGPGRVRHS